MNWKEEALKAAKKYYDTDEFEILDYEYYSNGIEIEYTGEDNDIHNYIIFENEESATEAAIEYNKEMYEESFDPKYAEDYIDVKSCYRLKPYMINSMAENIITFAPEYDIFEIIKELEEDTFAALEKYSELYIWHNEDNSVFNIDFEKCAKLNVEKFGRAGTLDNYYGNQEDILDGGFYSYPRD